MAYFNDAIPIEEYDSSFSSSEESSTVSDLSESSYADTATQGFASAESPIPPELELVRGFSSVGDSIPTEEVDFASAEDSIPTEEVDFASAEDSLSTEDYKQLDPLSHVIFEAREDCNVAPRFGLTGSSYRISFTNQDAMVDAEEVIRSAFDKVLTQAFTDAGPSDKVGVSIDHECLDTEILVHFGDKEETTTEKILQLISSIQQSKKELDFTSAMRVKITRISPPEGRGHVKLASGRFEDVFPSHSGGHGSTIIRIMNADWMCLARAVVLARAHHQYKILGDNSINWEAIRKGDRGRCTAQKNLALQLMQEAGISAASENQSMGYPEMKKIQKVLMKQDYQLKVFSRDHFDAVTFDDELIGPTPLCIYHHNNHFDVLKSPRILTGSDHFCHFCNRGYQKIEDHRCPKRCGCCKAPTPCQPSSYKTCPDCSRLFKSQTCFDKHLERPENYVSTGKSRKRRKVLQPSVCMKVKLCMQCGRCMSKAQLPPNKHNCGFRKCKVCHEFVKTGEKDTHQCYMQPLKERKKKQEEGGLLKEELEEEEDGLDALIREEEDRQGETEGSRQEHFRKHRQGDGPAVARYLFWDFETTQQDEVNPEGKLGSSYLHKPTYCIARKVCMLCKDFWLSHCENPKCTLHSCEDCQAQKPNCAICKDHYKRFEGEKCRDEFCDYLFREEHRGTIAIAHNAKGFDAQFIIQWCIAQKRIPKVIPRGLQILSLECMGVKVKDSFCFIPQSLASMPKTFNEPELKKGYFPYLFYRRENWDYIGPYPDADLYCPSQKKPAEREAFYKWYQKHKDGVFDMQKELREYTESDVDILLRCVMQFNDLFFNQTGIHPLEEAITIAQACQRVYRKNFLKENTIGTIPTGGYRGREKQSRAGFEWIKWMSHKYKADIRHVGNGKEKVVGKYKLDGYIPTSHIALEFHGCIWHGCPKHCRQRDKKLPNSSLTYEEVYQKTLTKSQFLKKEGYNLIEIWECEWNEQKRSDPEIQEFLQSLEMKQFLDPREALAGGRTNATYLWRKCKKGEKISYFDVCSLYPYVLKYCAFPLGHPSVITENFEDITKDSKPYFGLIRCRVLPPKDLLHPVLPYRHNNRLNFILCRTCLEENQETECHHSDSERSFTADFVSVEIDKAVDLGYKVEQIFEVWHYSRVALFDGEDEDTGLFTSYINQFLKLKQQASGWPSWVKTDADKDKYILEYEQKEGINLNPEEVAKNSGLRAIAKLCLNSFWGKFAQHDDLANREMFTDPNKFFDVICDPENDVSAVMKMGPDMVEVTYKKKTALLKPNPNVSLAIASFVTAHARLQLYNYIEKLNERTLYFDTDSVIFITRLGDTYMPPLGDHLGDLTDELSEYGEGCFISEFVSTGPKAYAFTVKKPGSSKIVKTVCKVKGFSLNFTNAAHINFKRMRKQVQQYVKNRKLEEVAVYGPQIRRSTHHELLTAPTRKVYKVVYCKRIVRPDYTTVPFGYVGKF